MNNPQYGRKWELKLEPVNGEGVVIKQDGIETESLKMIFDINYPSYQAIYMGDFIIYNLKDDVINQIMVDSVEGTEITFSAGYQYGKFGKLFKGYVFQSLFSRESVNNYKLHLHCIDGHQMFNSNFVKFSLPAEYTFQALVNAVTSRAMKPIALGHVSANIEEQRTTRGMCGYGNPQDLLRELVARQKNAQFFVKDNQVEIKKMEDEPDPNPIKITSKTGIIGTPQQIDYGITFKCLLNPDITLANPPKAVQLEDTLINQMVVNPGRMSSILPTGPISEANRFKQGYYQIAGVRHSGDTRGNDWYTEVTGYTQAGKAPYQLISGGIYTPSASTPSFMPNKEYSGN